jgi:hypothetical protein
MAASQFLADAILNWLKGESFPEAPPRGAFLSLHRGEPGPVGTEYDITAEMAAGRAQLPRELIGPIYSMPEGGRQVRNDEKLFFEGLAARDARITHVGFWSEPIGGEFYCGGPLISHTDPVPVFSPLDVLEGDQVSIPFPKLRLAVAGYIAPRGPVLTVELVDPGEGWGPGSPTGPLPGENVDPGAEDSTPGSGVEIIIERDEDGRPIGGTVNFPDGQGDGYEVGDIIVVDGAKFRVTGIGEYVAPPEVIEPPTIESFAARTASAGEWGEEEPWGPYDRGLPALHPSGKWVLLDGAPNYVEAWPWDDFLNYEFQTRVANDVRGGWGHKVAPLGTPPTTGIFGFGSRSRPIVSPSGKWVIVRARDDNPDSPSGWGNIQYWTYGFNADSETGNPFTDTGRVTGIETGLEFASRSVRSIIFHPSGQYLLVSFGGTQSFQGDQSGGTDVPYFCVFEWNDETGEIASGAFYPSQYPCLGLFDRYVTGIRFTSAGGAIIASHVTSVNMLDGSLIPQPSYQSQCLLSSFGLDPRKGVTAWSFNPENAGSGMNPIGLPLSASALPTIGSYSDALGTDGGSGSVIEIGVTPSGQTVAIMSRKNAFESSPLSLSLSFHPFDENAGFGSAYFDLTNADGEIVGDLFGLEFSPAADLVAFTPWDSVSEAVVGSEPSPAFASLSLNFLRFAEGVGAGQRVKGGQAGSGFRAYYGLVYSLNTATIFYGNQNSSGWKGMFATRPANYVPQAPPSELTELAVTEMAFSEVTVHWSWEPGQIRGFLVELSEDGVTYLDPVDVRDSDLRLRTLQGITQPWWSSLPGQPGVPVYEYSYTFEGLTSGTNYWIRVRAFNEVASSAPLVVTAQTKSLPSPGQLVPATYTQSSVYFDGLWQSEPANAVNMADGVYDLVFDYTFTTDPPWSAGPTLTNTAVPEDPSETEWIQMDFGSVTTFNSIVIGSDFDGAGVGTQFTESANIEISNDGTTWEVIGNAGEFSAGIQRYGFPGTSARYVRLTPSEFQDGVAASEFYADAAPFTDTVEPPLPSPQGEWVLVGDAFATANASNSGNITLTIGSASAVPQEGDLLIAHIAYRGNAPFSAPAGWTIHEQASDANTARSDFISRHGGLVASIIRGPSNPSSTFTRTGGANAIGRITIWRYSGGNAAFVSSHGERQPKHSIFLSGSSLDELPEDSLVLVSAFGATICDLTETDNYPALPSYGPTPDQGSGVIEPNRWRVVSASSRLAGNTTAKMVFAVLHKAGAGDTGAFRVEAGPATEQLLVVAAWAPVSP